MTDRTIPQHVIEYRARLAAETAAKRAAWYATNPVDPNPYTPEKIAARRMEAYLGKAAADRAARATTNA